MFQTSYSQIAMFQECPWKWWLSYVQKWDSMEKSTALTKGTVFHDWLEFFYRIKITGERDPVEESLAYAMRNSGGADQQDFYHMLALFKRYIEEFAPANDSPWEIIEAEKKFNLRMLTATERPYMLNGMIDLIGRNKRNDKIYSWDHKTSSRGFWGEMELLTDVQQPIYLIAMHRLNYDQFGDIKGIVVNMINMYHYKNGLSSQPLDKLFKRDSTPRTTQELVNIQANIGRVVDQMMNLKERWQSEPPVKNLSRSCNRCHLSDPCITDLKGHDISHMIGANFRIKGQDAKNEVSSQQPTP